MSEITITHTPENGTIVTGDPRPHQQALKDAGFRYSRNVGWYIRGSRDQRPQTRRINQAAEGLRTAGFEVTVDIEDELRPMAEREAARSERIDARQDALDAKADRKGSEAGALLGRASEMADMIPFGQPILVGHHSERRHRNHLDKIDNTMRRGVEAHREAERTADRADGSRANQRHRESGPATKRRIDKLETELRDIDRKLAGKVCVFSGQKVKPEVQGEQRKCFICGTELVYGETVPEHFDAYNKPASGPYQERLVQRQVEINDEILYWRDHLEAIGFSILGKDDFKKGDPIIVRGSLCTVVRANPKTVSVTSEFHSWPIKYGYEDVRKPSVNNPTGDS